MKVLFDLFPVILFFVAYTAAKRAPERYRHRLGPAGRWGRAGVAVEQAPILLATAVAIVATICQVGWLLMRAAARWTPCSGSASPSSS